MEDVILVPSVNVPGRIWKLNKQEIFRNHHLIKANGTVALAKRYEYPEDYKNGLKGLAIAGALGFGPDVYDYFTLEDGNYIVYEKYTGPNLEELLEANPLSWNNLDLIVNLLLRARELLSAAHDKGLLHNDPNLSNFIVHGDHLKLIDFDVSEYAGNVSSQTAIGWKQDNWEEFYSEIRRLYEDHPNRELSEELFKRSGELME